MTDDSLLLSLPTAARTRWRVQGALLWTFLLALLGTPAAILGALLIHWAVAVVVPLLVLAAGIGIGLWWANRRYERFGYLLDDEAIRVRDGVLSHSDAIAPLYRVQHVDLTRGPLQLVFGLASLAVHTAAPAADISLPDLHVDDAERVRDQILTSSRRAAAELGVDDVDAV